MKKLVVSTIAGILLLSGKCQAGFIDGVISPTTIANALTQKDDTPVTLEGKITKHLHKDKYLFTDDTGTVTVEIDRQDWNGIDVTPADTVRIRGEVDKGWYDTKIDVDSIEIVP